MSTIKAILYFLLAYATAALAGRGMPDLPAPINDLACIVVGALTGFPALALGFEHALKRNLKPSRQVVPEAPARARADEGSGRSRTQGRFQ